jgi:SAM-dependent methyltransferase
MEDDQAARWNGPAGRAWVDEQELLDRMLDPIGDRLLDAIAGRTWRRALDVGCGTGSTTLAVARRLTPHGTCVGIDVSEPMITAARARAAREHTRVEFILANAQVYAFEPASYDLIVSRFGVMFFDDPVRAFTNLRHAATSDAELRLLAWRSAAENPFMTVAERAAAPMLPDLPARLPDAPGQFAFGSRERVSAILSHSGWTAVDVHPLDVACSFPESELLRYLTRLGPVGVFLQGADEATRRRVVDAVRPAFEPFVQGADVSFNAACWLITGKAG